MRTMTLLERGLSTGEVSIGALLDGKPAGAAAGRLSVSEAIEALAVGGWPDNLDLTAQDALDANTDYLDVIVNTDIQRVDRVRRDPAGIRRLLASYARNVATDASLRTIGRTRESALAEATLHDYLRALRRLNLIEDRRHRRSRRRSLDRCRDQAWARPRR